MVKVLVIIFPLLITFLLYFLFKERRNNKNYEQINGKITELENKKAKLISTNNKLQENYKELEHSKMNIEKDINDAQIECAKINSDKENLLINIEDLSKMAEALKKQIEDSKINSKELLSAIENEYRYRLSELAETYDSRADEYAGQLNELKAKRDAAIQYAIAEEEKLKQIDFYKLQLTQDEIQDIQILKTIEQKLTNKEILGKIIYKVYIEKHYKDLIGRVVGNEKTTGIYKITNQNNQKCYIGQSVDISKRWMQHIKRAIGAEQRTNNKLYPAMAEEGIENFSFEIVEVCQQKDLNEREKYWQQFHGALEYGYSIK